MSARVTLLMAIHCHQPVGNFGFVFEEAFAKAYDPFLRVLERHPNVRLALHYSGCLLDWLIEHRPEFLHRVRRLVARGQVELLASGYYEPILPLIPEADRQGQIRQMRERLRVRFGVEAQGLWLTERVWEPELPVTLARAGMRYTMVDVNQFIAAKPWLPGALQVQDDAFWDVLGSYATDAAGEVVRLFPASKRLRYWMPFQGAEQTIGFLKRLQRDVPVAITFADDGEKFGFWPNTFRWVYDEGWLECFFGALERERAWLHTGTFKEYVAAHPPDGRVYLPSGSYEEMLEWSGGHFRNFFIKYPEANAMYQKMLRISRQLQEVSNVECRMSNVKRASSLRKTNSKFAIRNSKLVAQARQELYAGQCNCAYWHGVFGGLYLGHLRRAVYAHLIAAEALLNRVGGRRAAVSVLDADGDGAEEAHVTTPSMGLLADPREGGTITEWSLYGARLNLVDTLTRRHESYHDKLRAKAAMPVSAGAAAPASIHDILGVKEENLASHVVYDDHRRSVFLDYGLSELPTLHNVVRATWGERRLWSPAACRLEAQPRRRRAAEALRVVMTRPQGSGCVRKVITAALNDSAVEFLYELQDLSVPVIGLEFNLSLRDERLLAAHQEAQVSRVVIEQPGVGVRVTIAIDPPATIYQFPIETVSESEEGLERTYQGLCLMGWWTVGGARHWKSRLRWVVEGAPASPSSKPSHRGRSR